MILITNKCILTKHDNQLNEPIKNTLEYQSLMHSNNIRYHTPMVEDSNQDTISILRDFIRALFSPYSSNTNQTPAPDSSFTSLKELVIFYSYLILFQLYNSFSIFL